jgi:hypothetical protein
MQGLTFVAWADEFFHPTKTLASSAKLMMFFLVEITPHSFINRPARP